MSEASSKPSKTKRGTVTGGIILTGIGLIFLLSNFRILPHMGRSWPLILIVVGVALLAGAIMDRREPDSSSTPPAP